MYKVVGKLLLHQFETELNEAAAEGYRLVNFVHDDYYYGVMWRSDEESS